MTRYLSCHDAPTSPSQVQHHQMLRLPRKVHYDLCYKLHEASFTMADGSIVMLENQLVISHPPVRQFFFALWRRILYELLHSFALGAVPYANSPNAEPATKNDAPTSPNIATRSHSTMPQESHQTSFAMTDDSRMIRTWSEHELVISHPPVRWGYFSCFVKRIMH